MATVLRQKQNTPFHKTSTCWSKAELNTTSKHIYIARRWWVKCHTTPHSKSPTPPCQRDSDRSSSIKVRLCRLHCIFRAPQSSAITAPSDWQTTTRELQHGKTSTTKVEKIPKSLGSHRMGPREAPPVLVEDHNSKPRFQWCMTKVNPMRNSRVRFLLASL